MEAHDSAVWPSNQPYLRPIVMSAYLVAIVTLGVCLGKRMTTFKALQNLSVIKILILLVLADSFLFVFTSAVLIFGVGTSYSVNACALGIWWCIMLYTTSKIAIYLFLMERIHLVFGHAKEGKQSRLASIWYRIGAVLLMGWIAVSVAMITGRVSNLRAHDGSCVIGLKLYSGVLMISMDFIVNVYLSTAFVYPVYKSHFPKARRLARNSSIAALAALLTSCANIGTLIGQHGSQLSWVCLGSCGLDVTINAFLIYMVTNGKGDEGSTVTGEGSRRGQKPLQISLQVTSFSQIDWDSNTSSTPRSPRSPRSPGFQKRDLLFPPPSPTAGRHSGVHRAPIQEENFEEVELEKVKGEELV